MAPHTTGSTSSSRSASLLSLSALTTLLLTFPSLTTASFDCKEILAGKTHFNLGQLGGPHMVHWKDVIDSQRQISSSYNFTIDICQKLQWHKGGSVATECHHGTRVCAIRQDTYLDSQVNDTIHPIDIAGTYTTDSGRTIDAKFELLRDSKSNSDASREGVRAELHGGRYPDNKYGIDQRAIVEFVCDKDRTGLEGDEKDDGDKEKENGGDKDKETNEDKEKDGEEKEEKLRRRDGNQCEDSDKSLRFCGYQGETIKDDKKVQTLRLEWRTKYACEDAPNDAEGSHWGFFTWFIIILFLAIAAYLIFGSWLNYNRYGARGWDLLPHGDTIRDIPYILKDWARNVKDTMQGPGSRGGYSAV